MAKKKVELIVPASLKRKKSSTLAKPGRAAAAAQARPAGKAASETSSTLARAPVSGKKIKLVRDSFTIPKVEYQALAELKKRALALNRPVKKSELLRAGIGSLTTLGDSAFLAALNSVPVIKTGRPGGPKKQ